MVLGYGIKEKRKGMTLRKKVEPKTRKAGRPKKVRVEKDAIHSLDEEEDGEEEDEDEDR